MDSLDFSEDEIHEQLVALGYKNIPKHRLREFKQDLDELVRHGEWKSLASSSQINPAKSQTTTSQQSPPAYTKEKVSQCYLTSGEGFLLHAGQADHDRHVLTACPSKDHGRQQGNCDSYAQHSVALKRRLPPGPPGRLQVEPDPDDTLQPPLSDSCDSSASIPESHRGRFIKRKVLRKHKGQSLVCDESVYSEDSAPWLSPLPPQITHTSARVQVVNMYKTYGTPWDDEGDDKTSLNSSFWSDGERQEEEEGEVEEGEVEEIERVIGKKESTPVGKTEDSYQEASEKIIGEEKSKPVSDAEDSYHEAIEEEESKPAGYSEDSYQEVSEKVEIKRVIGKDESKPLGDAEDSYQETSEEEEEEIGRVISEEDSKLAGDSEDSYSEASEEEESKPVDDAEDSYSEDSEEEIERVISEEESNPVGDAEDSYSEASDEEIERVISEEESKLVDDAEDSYSDASAEEESKLAGYSEDFYQEASEAVEIKRVIGKKESKPLGDAEDSYQETSEEEEEEIGRVIRVDESNPVGDADDSYSEVSEEEESKPVGDAEDPHKEASEEEESKPVGYLEDFYQEASEKEESKPVGDAEDPHKEASEEEESKPVGDLEDFYQEASEEEESKPVGYLEDFYQEASEKEESKPVGDAEDPHKEASEEEESKPVGDLEDFYQEASEEEESKSVGDAEDPHKEASEEEKPELSNQVNVSRDTLEGGSRRDDEESCSSSSDSPAQSLMTSGYGTYRPEEQEGGDYRDDHTITEFDQDSRGDLSEVRDDEDDDRSLCSFAGFHVGATVPDYLETCPPGVLADAEPEANVARCATDDLYKEVDIADVKPGEDNDQTDVKSEEVRAASDNEVTNATSEERQFYNDVVEDHSDGNHLEGGCDDEGGEQYERLEEEVQDPKEEKASEDKVESEDPDESSRNEDIKFIDSKVDFRRMTLDKMCEREGNLRQKKDAASCLEERLADLRLSSPAQHDFETEHDEVPSQSETRASETEGLSFSAFESYIRGMTRSQSDGDLRPKPKSFIRPVMSQQTIKKTDPVAKYFQYKQLWEMFKLPGEKDRRDLRWEIRERLAYQPPPPKPRRVYVPNTYIVPTEKKRSALRWEIRNDLANGLPPHKFSHRF